MDQTPTASAMVSTIGRFTNLANMTGLPALSVPCGTSEGLPVGAQIVAGRFSEHVCFSVAAAVEDALGALDQPPGWVS